MVTKSGWDLFPTILLHRKILRRDSRRGLATNRNVPASSRYPCTLPEISEKSRASGGWFGPAGFMMQVSAVLWRTTLTISAACAHLAEVAPVTGNLRRFPGCGRGRILTLAHVVSSARTKQALGESALWECH